MGRLTVNQTRLIAFLATLVLIGLIAIAGALAMRSGKDASTYMATLTGLIAILGSILPKSEAQRVENGG